MLTLEEKAQNMADGLGISVYIRDGKIWQHGPGIEIRPQPGSEPMPHEIDIKKGEPSGSA